MTDDTIRYDLWVEEALRSVIHKTLSHVNTHGLSGEHHFYISFLTQDEGVHIPAHIRAQHPIEMTIVLQHQFDELNVEKDHFSVSLSFGGDKERLIVPYTSVVSFADPSVNFALQLKMMSMDEDEDEEFEGDILDLAEFPETELETFEFPVDSANQAAKDKDKKSGDSGDDDKKSGEVIALDAFRKK